jgi:hypothetical protein
MKEYLKLVVLDLHDNNKRIESNLEKIGIMHNSIIHDEIRDIILDHIRDELVQEVDFQQCKLKVEPSLFLKLLLLINRILKIPNNSYKAFELIDFKYDNGIISNDKILKYLLTRKLASQRGNDSLIIREENYKKWLSKKTDSIEDFYKYIFSSWDILKAIQSIMPNSKAIFKIDKLPEIKSKFKQEFLNLIKLGLITEVHLDTEKYTDRELYTEIENYTDTEKKMNIENLKLYILSPESWYMLSGQKPAQWIDSVIYANPDYEVFVPYNYNPFEVQIIDFYNGKEELKYDDDYFIISTINDYHKFKNNIFHPEDLLQSIKNNCDNIPDLYEYELFKEIWE